MAPAFTHRVTVSRLAMAALYYLLNHPQGNRWLSEHTPSLNQLNIWAEAIATGEIATEQVVQPLCGLNLSTRTLAVLPAPQTVITRWLLPLWQRKTVRNRISKQSGKEIVQQIDNRLSRAEPLDHQIQHISNAGVVLLWPLLPQMFSLLAHTKEQQFISDNARWQAVLSLDWLIWGTAPPVAERLRLNQLLCAIPPDSALPEDMSLSEEQQRQIDRWFTAVSQQLPAWQKFSLGDIRQLFLQRPGEIITETLPPQIRVRPESFDLLLGNWPWPLTMVQLPWLEQPLTLVWPFNGLEG